MPKIALDAINQACNPNAGIGKMVSMIEADVALTGKILRTANSSYFGMPRKIDSVRMASVGIGLDEISNIVVASSLLKTIPDISNSSTWDSDSFLIHSVAVAELTTGLYETLGLVKPNGAYAAALLHDLGRWILHRCFPQYSDQCEELAGQENILRFRAELLLLGVEHGLVGSWLLERWDLPEEITAGVARHHIRPTDSPTHCLAAAIDFADRLYYIIYNESSESAGERLRDDRAWREWIGSRGVTTPALVRKMQKRLERATRLLDILN